MFRLKLFRKSKAVTEYKESAERTHYTLGQDGWEEVADFALDWAVTNASLRPAKDWVRKLTYLGPKNLKGGCNACTEFDR